MKKAVVQFVCFVLAVSFPLTPTAQAEGKKFKNCTELNKVYKGGVARAANIKNKGGKTRYAPHVSKEIYEANTKSDRDKDGIACEK
ncbi:excalibur calcium-binding domain-containing protein [Paenibacillus gansuensis]|uniref:Excalibur calcium-binding domain-containing protein n=1 Tax=Paenibacillus gansuensis TaxID=306542 RepID=A0ABW5PGL1_9BACL